MVLGILGKIASGKSELLGILEKHGFYCIDADKIVHELYGSWEIGAKKVAEVFGEEFLDKEGRVDRRKLRDLVFTEEKSRRILNGVIHPLVYLELKEKISKIDGSVENIAIEAVSFGDEGISSLIDEFVWVKRSDGEIKKILVERGFNEVMIANVLGLYGEPAGVKFVIKNDGTLEDLEKKVESLIIGAI